MIDRHPPLLALRNPTAFDWAELHRAWVPGDPYQPEDGTEAYYRTKASVAQYVQPRRVVEIGVRAGYSALAFHMGWPFEAFVGFDKDEGTMGGVAGYAAHARERLGALPSLTVVHVLDTQSVFTLPPEAHYADLFHVDGDHTPTGCAHDLMLALQSGARWILVDDYDYSVHVREATDWVVRERRLSAFYVSDGGYRGNLLIQGLTR